MTFPDKLSDAGKQQLATHLDFFQSLTTRMFENAERIVALNIEVTRNTLDQASGAARQLAAAKDPRDLLAMGNQSQQQVEAVMAYSRKLLEIANQPARVATPAATAAAAPAPAPAPAADTAAPEEHIQTAPPVMVAEPAPEPAAQPAPAHSAILASEHPLGEADPDPAPAPAPAIPAKATLIAEAASQVAAAPLDMPHPAASPVPDAGPVTIPAITPVDATPAPAEAAAPPEPKRAKGARKR
jgi:phasin family protein